MPVFGRAIYSGVLGNAEVFNHTLGMRFDDLSTAAECLPFAVSFLTSMTTTTFLALYPTDVRWTRVRFVQLNTSTGDNMDAADQSVNIVGTSAQNSLPYECSVAVTLRSTEATRKGRGRFYLPPMHYQTLVAGGVVSPGNITVLVTNVGLALNTITTGAHSPIIIGNPDGPLTFRDVVAFDIGNVMDSQRRRRNNLVEVRSGAAVS